MADQDALDALNGLEGHNAGHFLQKLGLESLPSKEELYRDVEQALLLPKPKLPDHWLGQYQV